MPSECQPHFQHLLEIGTPHSDGVDHIVLQMLVSTGSSSKIRKLSKANHRIPNNFTHRPETGTAACASTASATSRSRCSSRPNSLGPKCHQIFSNLQKPATNWHTIMSIHHTVLACRSAESGTVAKDRQTIHKETAFSTA